MATANEIAGALYTTLNDSTTNGELSELMDRNGDPLCVEIYSGVAPRGADIPYITIMPVDDVRRLLQGTDPISFTTWDCKIWAKSMESLGDIYDTVLGIFNEGNLSTTVKDIDHAEFSDSNYISPYMFEGVEHDESDVTSGDNNIYFNGSDIAFRHYNPATDAWEDITVQTVTGNDNYVFIGIDVGSDTIDTSEAVITYFNDNPPDKSKTYLFYDGVLERICIINTINYEDDDFIATIRGRGLPLQTEENRANEIIYSRVLECEIIV